MHGEKDNVSRDWKALTREYVEAIVIAFVLAMLIRTFVVQAFKIPSGSMKPNLLIGDHLLVNKFIYGIKNPFTDSTLVPIEKPKRGDVVVFIYPVERDKDFIKRVVGIEGDRVQIVNKKVSVNGQPMPDNHTMHTDGAVLPPAVGGPRDNFGPYSVPPNSIFVMGDNRDQSYDSRFWGPVNLKDIKGKAFIVYWSWDSTKLAWGRFWKAVWSWDTTNFVWGKFWRAVRWNRFGKIIH